MLKNIENTTERVLSLFEEVVDSYANESAKSGSESLTKEEIGNNRERIKERIRHLIRIVFACSDIEKPKDDLPKGTVIFETDLHGDLTAFLCTLLENGMVKFNEANPTGIILYDPIEKKEYKLDELENLKKTNKSEFDNLIERIQILPDITPTETYSQYINCGDFVDRGEQSEQMAYMIPFLSIRYKGKFNDKPLPKLIVGNHENFYLVRRYDVAFGNGADSMFSTNSNTTIFYRINIGLATDSITNRLREMTMSIRNSVMDGELCLAHSIGTTIFTHALITKDMVEEVANAFNKLSGALKAQEKSSTKKRINIDNNAIHNLAERFNTLSKLIKDDKPFDIEETEELVRCLNEFNIIRTVIIIEKERIEESPEKEEYEVLPGEDGIIKVMNMKQNGSAITDKRKYDTRKEEFIRGITFIQGHDTNRDFNGKSERYDKWAPLFDGIIAYIDSSRSSGYNEGITNSCFFRADEEYFRNSKGKFLNYDNCSLHSSFSSSSSHSSSSLVVSTPLSRTKKITPDDIRNRKLNEFVKKSIEDEKRMEDESIKKRKEIKEKEEKKTLKEEERKKEMKKLNKEREELKAEVKARKKRCYGLFGCLLRIFHCKTKSAEEDFKFPEIVDIHQHDI